MLEKRATDEIQSNVDALIKCFKNDLSNLQTASKVENNEELFENGPEKKLTEMLKGMKVDLMSHQKCGLGWMLFRESLLPRGGILADELGKPISLLSLIVAQKNVQKSSFEIEKAREEAMKKTFENRLFKLKIKTKIHFQKTLILWRFQH